MSFSNYEKSISEEQVFNKLEKIKSSININDNKLIAELFTYIDFTSLNSNDNESIIKKYCNALNTFTLNYSDFKDCAAFCIYPNHVATAKKYITKKNIKIACVSGGFPSSQTFLSVKLAETKLAVEKGADEIDIVMPIGLFLENDFQKISDEISIIKIAAGNAKLKVILETGLMPTLTDIRIASILAMESGADFIKTSTGKVLPAASPEAVLIMCEAIKDYFERTGRMIGIKPAGGISSVYDAMLYYSIIKFSLGNSWINPMFFRIGASKLANNLLKAYYNNEDINFF